MNIARSTAATAVAILLTFFTMPASFTYAYSATTSAEPSTSDIMILVSISGFNMVSLAYPKAVAKDDVQKDIACLVNETGWSVSNVNIATESDSPGHLATSADFMFAPAEGNQPGYLPIEGIVTAFKNLPNVEIVYMVPPNFRFIGPQGGEDRYAKVLLKPATNSYEYDIHIKDASFGKFVVPAAQNAKPAIETKSQPKKSSVTAYVVIILAIVMSAFVYILMIGKPTNQGRCKRS